MSDEQKTAQHDDIETRLRTLDAKLAEGETADPAKLPELIADVIVFIEDQFGLIQKLADRLDTEEAARSFYAQTLVAISKYRGGDKTLPQLMALVAVADVLPEKPDAHT